MSSSIFHAHKKPARYELLTFTSMAVGEFGEPTEDGVELRLATAVNEALSAGASLVGGVSVALSPKGPHSAPLLIMSQAVLYPASA